MSWLLKIVVLSLTFILLPYSLAADSVNLLIMIEDADKDSVPRNSRINKRVHDSVSQQLNHIADVYDETSMTLNDFKRGRVRRTDSELLDIARSITRPPIDIIVVLNTYASINTSEYAKKARARVAGRLINAKSGQFLDSFEVQSPRSWTIPYDCDRQTCMLEEMADEAKVLGDELGLILAEKLNWLLNGGATDNNYDQAAKKIDEYLLVFSGYISHRPTQQRYTRTTLLYRSTINSAKLSRNMHKLLDELNMRATINFEGNSFRLKRITLRGENATRDIADGW
jgi:hypothetical protein